MDAEIINSREFAKRVANYKTDKTIQKEVQAVHYKMFGKYFKANCRNCIMKAYVDIRTAINSKMVITQKTKKQMGQFEIKKSKNGLSKQIYIDHDVITNDNLTDEKAIAILRKAPGHIVTFSKFPENWKELTEQPIVKKQKESAPDNSEDSLKFDSATESFEDADEKDFLFEGKTSEGKVKKAKKTYSKKK